MCTSNHNIIVLCSIMILLYERLAKLTLKYFKMCSSLKGLTFSSLIHIV